MIYWRDLPLSPQLNNLIKQCEKRASLTVWIPPKTWIKNIYMTYRCMHMQPGRKGLQVGPGNYGQKLQFVFICRSWEIWSTEFSLLKERSVLKSLQFLTYFVWNTYIIRPACEKHNYVSRNNKRTTPHAGLNLNFGESQASGSPLLPSIYAKLIISWL